MKLYSSKTSPYGRIARIVRLEKRLEDRITFEPVQTRGAENPYYEVNPSGRVPALVLDDGTLLEDSSLVCWYMDNLDGAPTLHPPQGMAGLEHRRVEAMARSMLDGVSLWAREYLYRDAQIRSPTIIAHEQARALRLADVFEREVRGNVLSGPLNMAQITLACVLHGRANDSPQGFRWRDGRANLCAWVERISAYPSVVETLPPPRG
ncbi:MAG: glutathione S-transferase N-terminal domain-containing protein [Gammaproteobacteria bacterium]|nr:glutathione S-transferase N-terminal domain-containing protein [Gammaproteobacteria bacterium]